MTGAAIKPTVWMAGLAVIAATASASAQDIDEGRAEFEDFCVVCHGEDARGAGPMAEVLTVAPPDLTALASENNGVFPVVRVVRQIDGRDPMLAHGGVMPLFGPFFEGKKVPIRAENGQTILASEHIADIAAYLQSIQQ